MIHIDTDDKSQWPDGPWQHEPDYAFWDDETTGLRCVIRRGPMGSLNGYVGVPEGHPLWDKSYDPPEDAYSMSENARWWNIVVHKKHEYRLHDIQVHGGLTYAGPVYKGNSDGLHYFGFDTAHAYDLNPKIDRGMPGMVYRNWAYVKGQVEQLALQLGKMHHEQKRTDLPACPGWGGFSEE